MAKYTTEVRFICEDAYGLTGEEERRPSINQITSSPKVLNKIFDFPFPIFDEAYRPVLEQKILKRYYTREIGEETVELWKLRLDTRLNEIMPYYNKLYASELIEFNPLYNSNYTREGNKDGKVLTDNSEDKTYNELTGTDNTEVRTPELKDQKTLDLNDLKTLDLNDLRTLDLNDLKTLDLEDLKTLDLNDLKTLDLNDLKTLNLNDLKTLNLKDKETVALNDLKTLNLNDKTTRNLTTDFDGQEDTSYSEQTVKRSGVWDLYSDTPQGGVQGIAYAQSDPSLATNGYLTNARHTFGDGGSDTTTGTKGVTTDNQTRETGTSDLDRTGTENLAKTGTDTLDKTGTETLAKTGTDSLDRTGTESIDRTGTDTLERTGTESVDKTGTDSLDRTGTENLDRTGTETLDRTGKETVKFDGEVDKGGSARSVFDGEQNSTENYLEKVVGWNGSNPNKYLEDYRNNFLNIDLDIINKLRDLFMNIW